MKVQDLKFRQFDRQFFFVENLKDVKKIYKKLRIRDEVNPIIIFSYIHHDNGIQFRILGNIVIEDKCTKIEDSFINNEYLLPYDFMEDIEIKEIPEKTIATINGTQTIKISIAELYSNKKLLQSREDTKLDLYRDIRLVDDVQFLLLNREDKQENVWARIESIDEKDLLLCTLLDKTKKSFGLKPNDKIYIKYVEHPKYTGLMFVKKASN